MSRLGNDLSSVVSTISVSSGLVGLECDGREDEEHGDEPPELKYVPPVPKSEILDTGENTCEGTDDDVFKCFLGGNCSESEPKGDVEGLKVKEDEEEEGTNGRSRKRGSGRRTRLLQVKIERNDYSEDNADDNDEWEPDNFEGEDEWGPSKRKKRASKRKVSKKRGEVERKRKVRNVGTKQRGEGQNNGQDLTTVPHSKMESGSTASLRGGKRKKLNEMTPEEAEQERSRWREQRRKAREKRKELTNAIKNELTGESDASLMSTSEKCRSRRRSALTPEERAVTLEKRRARDRERKRMMRALAKEGALSEEQQQKLAEQYRKDRERKRLKRAAMAPEKKQEESQKSVMNRYSRMATLNDDEKRARQMHDYMQRMARLARMTPEEKEQLRLREREKRVQRYYKWKEAVGGAEGARQARRKYWESMTPEQREQARLKFKETYRRKCERLKQEGRLDEMKKMWNEKNKQYKQKWMDKSDEEKPKSLRTREPKTRRRRGQGPYARKRLSELTEEEKERKRERNRIYMMRRKLAIQKLLDSGMSIEEVKHQIETPEQRERRLIKARLRKARGTLRKRLLSIGASPEEIQRQVEELNRTFQTDYVFRPYKPRPENWRRVDPTMEILGAVNIKSKITNQPLLPPSITNAKNEETPTKKETVPSTKPCSSTKESTFGHQQQLTPSTQLSGLPGYSQQSHLQLCSSSNPHPSQSIFPYPHQQPQIHPQPYTLQQMLDGIIHHETGLTEVTVTTGPPIISCQQISYQYEMSTTSSQHEYGSSYYDDDNNSHPPASPPGRGDFTDFPSYSYNQPQQQLSIQCSTVQNIEITGNSMVSNTGEREIAPPPRKPRKPKRPNIGGASPKTRKKRANVIWDSVCDECGQPYNHLSLRQHKNRFHNPNYDLKTRKCLICGEAYSNAERWHKHYLREHVRPNEVKPCKTHICAECGQGFVNKANYLQHHYHMHGDGLKKENHIRCEFCPEEKLFNRTMGYRAHLQRFHPEYTRTGHDCYRCDKSYPNEKVLGDHVRATHPESYFPCPHCPTAFRFTKLGLNFHMIRCPKMTKEEKAEWKKRSEGVFSLEAMPIPCELCGRKVTLGSLTRHYQDMHNVKEDQFKCQECHKVFKRRGFWATHMEEKHQVSLEDLTVMASKLNAINREGMLVKPLGTRGGNRHRRTKSVGGKNQTKRKPKEETEMEESEEDSMSDNSGNEYGTCCQMMDKRTFANEKKRRKIKVIAEEDEMETIQSCYPILNS